jgi:hypothetical protein
MGLSRMGVGEGTSRTMSTSACSTHTSNPHMLKYTRDHHSTHTHVHMNRGSHTCTHMCNLGMLGAFFRSSRVQRHTRSPAVDECLAPEVSGSIPTAGPSNGASVVLSEGQCEHGVLQDSCKAMGTGWFGVVCVCGARSSFGECGVCLWACVCVGFVCRCWVGVVMLRHDSECDDVWNAMRVGRVV